VMEVARCLTGWTVRSTERVRKGRVEFRPQDHDDGEKAVLGRRIPAGGGPRDLERVLDIVAHHPSTARHLATKLCRRFIDEDPPEAAVATVAQTFEQTRGDIRSVLRTLFNTSAFHNAAPTRFKRPFRFVISALRASAAETDGIGPLEYLQRMGHAPFQYSTPDGYPDEAAPWLGTLLWRWHFAAALSEDRVDGTKVDWSRLVQEFGGPERLMSHLLQRRPTSEERDACRASGIGPAFILATPAFQRH
jgi:uncharacterized protein (DUF1800 family)